MTNEEIEEIRERHRQARQAGIGVPVYEAALLKEVDLLRKKNRELNRRAQRAASQARKDLMREMFGGEDPLFAWRVARMLGIDPSQRSMSVLTSELEATLTAMLRHIGRLQLSSTPRE